MTDILERLDQVANFKVGEVVDGFGPIEWATTLSKLCADAAAEIRSLRQLAGVVSTERSFTDIKQEIKNGSPS